MVEIDFIHKEGKVSATGPHASYDYNLFKAQEFIQKTSGHLPPGLEVKLRDSHGLKKSLLTFSYNHSLKGVWANPICLHQSGETFRNELWAAASFYKELAESDPARRARPMHQDRQNAENPACRGLISAYLEMSGG